MCDASQVTHQCARSHRPMPTGPSCADASPGRKEGEEVIEESFSEQQEEENISLLMSPAKKACFYRWSAQVCSIYLQSYS